MPMQKRRLGWLCMRGDSCALLLPVKVSCNVRPEPGRVLDGAVVQCFIVSPAVDAGPCLVVYRDCPGRFSLGNACTPNVSCNTLVGLATTVKHAACGKRDMFQSQHRDVPHDILLMTHT